MWTTFPLITICIATAAAQASIKISDGEEATPHEFPWILYMDQSYTDPPFCSAILITSEWALTAANCLRITSAGITLTAGEHNVQLDEGSEQTRHVVATVYHPEYNESYTDNLALLKVSPPFEFNQFVQSAPLPHPTQEPSANCTMAGWGEVDLNYTINPILLKAHVQYLNHSTCAQSYIDYTSGKLMCAGRPQPSGVGLCYGDQGSPLLCYDGNSTFLCGIGAYTRLSCEGEHPSLFTKIEPYLSWTMDTIANYNRTDNITWAESTTCGGVLVGTAGRISYKVGVNYETNERCVWTIRTTPGRWVNYRLRHYGLTSGAWVSETRILNQDGLLDRSRVIEPGTSYGMNAATFFITFYTDSTASPGLGFSFDYFGSDTSDLEDLKYSHDTIIADGAVSYPPGGGEYQPYELATWVINPGPFNARLNVTRVDIEKDSNPGCGFDALRIYSLGSDTNYLEQAVLCGITLPPYPLLTENGIFIAVFKSDYSSQFTGFDFSWEKLPDTPTTTTTTTTTTTSTTTMTPVTTTTTPLTSTTSPTTTTTPVPTTTSIPTTTTPTISTTPTTVSPTTTAAVPTPTVTTTRPNCGTGLVPAIFLKVSVLTILLAVV